MLEPRRPCVRPAWCAGQQQRRSKLAAVRRAIIAYCAWEVPAASGLFFNASDSRVGWILSAYPASSAARAASPPSSARLASISYRRTISTTPSAAAVLVGSIFSALVNAP
jgi:hypothetical protein